MRSTFRLIAFLLATTVLSYADDCVSLSEAHEVFKLREAAQVKGASEFCLGAADINSLQLSSGRKHLGAFLRSNPNGEAAYRTHELLAYAYLRIGRHKEALSEIETLHALKPSADDPKQMISVLSMLTRYPDQVATHLEPSEVQADRDGKIPMTINGKEAAYFFDTGANISVISNAEARRFGMKVESTLTTMGDSGGLQVGLRVADAEDLVVGKIHLKHVAFAVLPDDQQPFVDVPQNQRGLIGIPVIIAMRSILHDRSGHFRLDGEGSSRPSRDGNLLLDGASPVVQVSSEGKQLAFTLDTGAVNTDLGPAFGRALPDVLAEGTKEKQSSTGFGGSVVRDSTRIAKVRFNIGGKDVELAPAFVLDDVKANARLWAAGNLGHDLLDQAESVSIDFQSMNLTLR